MFNVNNKDIRMTPEWRQNDANFLFNSKENQIVNNNNGLRENGLMLSQKYNKKGTYNKRSGLVGEFL